MVLKLLILGVMIFLLSTTASSQCKNITDDHLSNKNTTIESAQRLVPVFIKNSFSIGEEKTNDDKKWIVMKADYSALIKADLETLSSILMDYEEMPRIFKNIENVKVVDTLVDGVITKQTTIVRGLGFSFRNTLHFKISNKMVSPDVFTQTFSLHKGDKATLKTEGSWTVESLEASRGCIVSYQTKNIILHQYPLQDAVMAAFGATEIKKLFFELCEVIDRRGQDNGF